MALHRHRTCRARLLFAVARLPVDGGDETALSMLLAMVLFGGTTLSAQRGMGGPADQNIQSSHYAHRVREEDAARNRLYLRRLRTRDDRRVPEDPCMTSHEMRTELAALIDEGKNHDEIIQAFITKHGSQEMLGAPIDRGFSRLAWLFPYWSAPRARSRLARGGEVDASPTRRSGGTARRGARGAHRR
jgi:cytochrome c-type biogenesis protein CcmH/NrfF